MKPDDVTQNAWDMAVRLPIVSQNFDDDDLVTIARAITAAVAAEREACAQVADRWTVEPDPDETDPYDEYEMGGRSSARSVASAIRSRVPPC